ncbi:alpha-galactosidase [Bifidobacterium lemurum]|uniref:Alpha-galactosidase n=2 Tax=Bifidobacterium lemurum TaxID=1603886 RepID=A0A261FU60_9BIFI|nr:glycoside hydrolase family 36 protein [Bifidobacterium lemurum]OZG62648.1 alpha-galactosidase [Bifidobacterium lemurum]QOL34630.1 alpha-galactosidase [Bifidobacterium lemurum]
MAQTFTWNAGSVAMAFSYDAESPVTVPSIVMKGIEVVFPHRVPIVEINTVGDGHRLSCNKLTHTVLGQTLRYRRHREESNGSRKALTIELAAPDHGIAVFVRYEVDGSAAMVRTETTVVNENSVEPVILDSITSWTSSFGAPQGGGADMRSWNLTEGAYDWLAEGRWRTTPIADLLPAIGQELTNVDPRQQHAVISSGTWSTGRFAPLGILESRELGLTWLFQIEHNGAWRWDVQDDTVDGVIALAGPTSENHNWERVLRQGESFTAVPVSFTVGCDFDAVIANVTDYRRAMRSPHRDNDEPRVVFNDYMNTLYGDPTTAKELPLIKAAGEIGVEIFVIDCGWYDDSGDWWPSVGEWIPSATRFPGEKGIVEVIDAIRDAGMVPGIWLEPEVIGVKSPMAWKLPDSAFFQRHGQRVVEQDRYILDLRDRAARAHLDAVIDRLVNEYGIGYFKMDYNVSPGAGTDYRADSPGEGLLGHNRAYCAWVDDVRRRHPDVILENCSSGGMREDFAQLSRFQVQSTSDQQDYRLYPAIASSALMMALPEQSANWAYPQADMTLEQAAFNINTTFLGRFFLSGYINRMDAEQHALTAAGIDAYKRYVQPVVGKARPFWPLGLPEWTDTVVAVGLDAGATALVTVWNRDGGGSAVDLAMPRWSARDALVEQVFPEPSATFSRWSADWDSGTGTLSVDVPAGGYVSRTFRLTFV